MPRWRVKLYGIEWDEWGSRHEHDLPQHLAVTVTADDKSDAFYEALRKVSIAYGTRIYSTAQLEAKRA